MTAKLYIPLTWFLLLLCSCATDPLIEPHNPLTKVVSEGTILDLAVNNDQIVYSRAQDDLVIIDRHKQDTKYYHRFNSPILEVRKIQRRKDDSILIADNRSGIIHFVNQSPQFIVRSASLAGFDDQGQFCYRSGLSFNVERKNGLVKKWNTWSLRTGTNAQTCMVTFNDTVWVGTKRSGLYYIDINDPVQRSINEQFQGNYENVQLHLDAHNNIWSLCTKYLTTRIDGSWAVYRYPNAFTATDIVTINNVAYISTDKGIYTFENETFTPVSDINNHLIHRHVTCLTLENDSILWFGTGAGIYTYPIPK